jgi:hypothetical protein
MYNSNRRIQHLKKGGKNMALSPAQRKANDKYIAENYKQVKLSMPKAEAEVLDNYCKKHNLTKAGFIREAIKEKMLRDDEQVTE